MLRDLGRVDCFYIEGVIEHLKKEWWRGYINEPIGEGRIPEDLRALFRRGWERTSQQDVIYRDIKVGKCRANAARRKRYRSSFQGGRCRTNEGVRRTRRLLPLPYEERERASYDWLRAPP